MDFKKKEKEQVLSEREEVIIKLEKQIAIGVWIQAVGQLIELVSLYRLNLISDEEEPMIEKQFLTGASLQTIGTFLEAIGVTEEIGIDSSEISLGAQKLAVTGDWLQALGTILEAVTGSEIIKENANLFVP
ncbi:hypothetical protein [Neobacillus bataviensis]|uniref:hypothetical protein n=1 Tax=Neobacillus bataviensis TaxID=220685 RepID=UPI001CBD2860|nr:hypothetical protein [Neobacillus bataviensis]